MPIEQNAANDLGYLKVYSDEDFNDWILKTINLKIRGIKRLISKTDKIICILFSYVSLKQIINSCASCMRLKKY